MIAGTNVRVKVIRVWCAMWGDFSQALIRTQRGSTSGTSVVDILATSNATGDQTTSEKSSKNENYDAHNPSEGAFGVRDLGDHLLTTVATVSSRRSGTQTSRDRWMRCRLAEYHLWGTRSRRVTWTGRVGRWIIRIGCGLHESRSCVVQ